MPAERLEQGDEGEEECKPIRLKKNQRVLTLAWQNLMSPSGNAEALMALTVCLSQLSIHLLVLTFTMCCNVTANGAPPILPGGGGTPVECVKLPSHPTSLKKTRCRK